jgi:hypothetical protein
MRLEIIMGCVAALVMGAVLRTGALVPAPYTPVLCSPTEFRCLGRTVKLGKMLLPTQAVAAGRNVLGAPVAVVADAGALDGLHGRGRVLENAGDAAKIEWRGESAGFSVRSLLDAECDGFCWYEITLTPKRALRLSSLRLDLPRTADTARYLHTAAFTWGTTSQGLPELGGSWSSGFMPYVWLGDERRGLAWCCESDEGWRLRQPAKALRMTTIDDRVLFTMTVLDHAETLNAPVTLRFGLQLTPVKPISMAQQARFRILHDGDFGASRPGANGAKPLLDAWRDGGVRTIVNNTWTDYYGKITTPYGDQLRQQIAECHKRGMKLLVYIGYGVAASAPDLRGHHDAWSSVPLIRWDMPVHDEHNAFDATCPNSGWADWLVAGIDKLFTEYDLDGLYFDGTSEAHPCRNETHGCGWRDETGRVHIAYPLLATRRLMRRIADTVHRHRPDAILDVHMSNNLTMPTLSFCDSYWDGEQFELRTAAEQFEIPLHAFRTEFMGYAHGLNSEFLCYRDRPFTFPEAIALAWLHNVEVRPLYLADLDYVGPIWRAMDRFDAVSARWLPYWEGSGVRGPDETVQASVYLRRGRALIFISHLKRAPLKAVLYLDRRRLGLGGGPLGARDALTGAALPLTSEGLPVDFDGMTYRLVEVGPAGRF